ncbi:MAG TPA: hypothetical protein VKY90_10355 [Candidatus Dormibacteraeota bacterium]|nr:hypothetical protein [Candidatus Dormibacteraeota bacterium]
MTVSPAHNRLGSATDSAGVEREAEHSVVVRHQQARGAEGLRASGLLDPLLAAGGQGGDDAEAEARSVLMRNLLAGLPADRQTRVRTARTVAREVGVVGRRVASLSDPALDGFIM